MGTDHTGLDSRWWEHAKDDVKLYANAPESTPNAAATTDDAATSYAFSTAASSTKVDDATATDAEKLTCTVVCKTYNATERRSFAAGRCPWCR